MPHLQLELSANVAPLVNLSEILADLTSHFCEFETIDPLSVKSYVRVSEVYQTGPGAPTGFVHLTICVLEGRPSDLLSRMSDSLFSRLQTHFHPYLSSRKVGVTLELRQMASATYRK